MDLWSRNCVNGKLKYKKKIFDLHAIIDSGNPFPGIANLPAYQTLRNKVVIKKPLEWKNITEKGANSSKITIVSNVVRRLGDVYWHALSSNQR